MKQVGSGADGAATPPVPHAFHLATFYDRDAVLVDVVTRFVAPALAAGDAGVLLATPEHLALFEAAFIGAGMDPEGARREGRLVALDAGDVLSGFDREGTLDPERFRSTVGSLIEAAGRDGRQVRCYGEMVALLWADGRVVGALELEDLWNDLASDQPFALLCGYPTGPGDAPPAGAAYQAVCERHAAVIPGSGSGAAPEVAGLLGGARDETREPSAQARARTEFTAMVAHEIRSPAGTASGYLEMLREYWREFDEDEIIQCLDVANRKVAQIERLAGDLLTVMQIEAGAFRYEVQPVDLEPVVREVADETERRSGRRIEVDCRHAPHRALADEVRQGQVLTNLLSNAIKFSLPGTAVRVETALEADEIVVRVRDRGHGLSAEDIERLFRPFARLERPGGTRPPGSGLGLHITRALVEGQGGRLWVDSTVGSGSTFTYTVPVATSV